MARAAEEKIDRLRRNVSIERLAEARGVQLRHEDGALVGVCPFHEEDVPALTLDTKANTWACSGCEVTAGDVLAWTMKAEGVSRRHAVELLQGEHSGAASPKVVKNSSVQKLPPLLSPDADEGTLFEAVASYYAATLKQTPAALSALAKHGITAETIERFRVGLSDRTLGYRVPKGNRNAGAELRGRLRQLGVLRETGHESLRGCITVPIVDERRVTIGLYGRRLDARAVEAPHLCAGAAGIFNTAAFEAGREVVVCASVFDALLAWSHGVRHATCVTAETDDAVVAKIASSPIAKVMLLFPRTTDGHARAEQVTEKLSGLAVEVFRVLLPVGMDVQALVASSPSPREGLAALLRQAEWFGGVRSTSPTAARATQATSMPTETTETTTTASPTANGEVTMDLGDRRWRIRGLANNLSYERLRVHLFVSRETNDPRTGGFFVDSVDLYSARQRNAFVDQGAEELGLDAQVVKRDLGQVLLRLEALQDDQIRAALQPKALVPSMSDEGRAAAMALLRDPKLLDRVVEDFDRCGVVGENDNKVVGYLAATSRMLRHPLAVVVQSSSGSGKSSLMETILDFVPEEHRRSFSALTGQSIFYMGEADLAHKVLSIAEDEGAMRAGYALKVLQSEGVLTIASTAKEAGTGRLVTHEYRVQGPVAMFTTTTAIDVDEELLSRCIVLSVDEGAEQTRAIQARQREAQMLDGLFARIDRDAIVQLHRNAQRLLRPLAVVNPFASEMGFADHRVRARRDHRKYLGLIETIALLHQHQRPVKTAERHGVSVEYVEVTREDIAVADRLLASVLARGLDELAPMTSRFLSRLEDLVQALGAKQGLATGEVRFTRREVREHLGVGGTQAWVHLRRLIEGEFLVVHPSRRGRGVVFELVVDAARTSTSSGDGGASSGLRSGDVRDGDSASPPPEPAFDPHRSASGRRHVERTLSPADRTSSVDGAA